MRYRSGQRRASPRRGGASVSLALFGGAPPPAGTIRSAWGADSRPMTDRRARLPHRSPGAVEGHQRGPAGSVEGWGQIERHRPTPEKVDVARAEGGAPHNAGAQLLTGAFTRARRHIAPLAQQRRIY